MKSTIQIIDTTIAFFEKQPNPDLKALKSNQFNQEIQLLNNNIDHLSKNIHRTHAGQIVTKCQAWLLVMERVLASYAVEKQETEPGQHQSTINLINDGIQALERLITIAELSAETAEARRSAAARAAEARRSATSGAVEARRSACVPSVKAPEKTRAEDENAVKDAKARRNAAARGNASRFTWTRIVLMVITLGISELAGPFLNFLKNLFHTKQKEGGNPWPCHRDPVAACALAQREPEQAVSAAKARQSVLVSDAKSLNL